MHVRVRMLVLGFRGPELLHVVYCMLRCTLPSHLSGAMSSVEPPQIVLVFPGPTPTTSAFDKARRVEVRSGPL